MQAALSPARFTWPHVAARRHIDNLLVGFGRFRQQQRSETPIPWDFSGFGHKTQWPVKAEVVSDCRGRRRPRTVQVRVSTI